MSGYKSRAPEDNPLSFFRRNLSNYLEFSSITPSRVAAGGPQGALQGGAAQVGGARVRLPGVQLESPKWVDRLPEG